MQKADVGAGVGLIMLSAWVFWYAGTYRGATIYFYGPNFFPQVLSIAMAASAAILLYKGARGRNIDPGESIHFRGFLRMLAAIAMCIAYLFLMQILGFAISTSIFLFSLMTFLGKKGIFLRAFAAVITSLIVWAIFRFFLIIPLPTGEFDFTF
ncbi:MAG: tripartite tricarboxylate transporter TctB family protein [Desulfarculaceae bacterium]|jgi:putative tricarboxylic transport membrane protein